MLASRVKDFDVHWSPHLRRMVIVSIALVGKNDAEFPKGSNSSHPHRHQHIERVFAAAVADHGRGAGIGSRNRASSPSSWPAISSR